jgi:hypothetical protein
MHHFISFVDVQITSGSAFINCQAFHPATGNIIREVSHQYEYDYDNEHVITLWVRVSKSRRHLAPFRLDKFVMFQTNMI